MRAVYSLTAEDRSEAQRGYYSALSGLRLFYAVTTPLALGAAALGLDSAQVAAGAMAAWFFAVAVLLLLVRPFLRWFRSARRFPDGTLEIETSEQGLQITSAQGRWETPWTAFRKYYETRNLFLLSYASQAFDVVPKRALAGADCDGFRQLISAKIRHAMGNAEIRIVRALVAFALLSCILFAFFGGTIQLALERVTNFLAGTTEPQTTARSQPVKEQVATRAQLHGRGAIYFVPIGGAAQLLHPSLAEYYLQKYGITVDLLPAIPLPAWAEDRARHQVVAEELIEAIRRAYPAQSKEQDAILIGVTDQDLCIGEYDWEFSFNFRQSKRIAVVSTARMKTDSHGIAATPELIETRLRKLLTKNIGVLYYHLDPSSEPTSVLYSYVQDANTLDAMGEDYLLRDVQYADSHDEDDDESGSYSGGDPCLTLRHHDDPSRPRSDFAYLSGCGKFHGDPEVETLDLDLRYGMVILRRTDFYLGGRLPLELTRVLRTQDKGSRAFGIGGNHSLNLWPVGNRWPFTWIDLIFEDGGRAHYKRTSWGIAYWDAVYRDYADTGSDWYGSAFRWNWPGFALAREDGSTYYFPDGDRVQRSEQAALIGVRNRWGETLKLERESHGNLVSAVSSAGPWIKFKYDAQNRMIEGQDSEGRTVSYRYNPAGYLEQVVDSGRTVHYSYDSSNRLSRVAVNGRIVLAHEFDGSGRISKLAFGDNEIYSFDYVVSSGTITQVDITDPADNRWHISLSKGGYRLEQLRSGNPKSPAQAMVP